MLRICRKCRGEYDGDPGFEAGMWDSGNYPKLSF